MRTSGTGKAFLTGFISLLVIHYLGITQAAAKGHPKLVTNTSDITEMRAAIQQEGGFRDAYLTTKAHIDQQLLSPIEVPVPKDAGGGYTHEQHKRNYQLMYDVGIIYQLSQDKRYADYVKSMLNAYAAMYPELPLHPKRKSRNQGKLFWQGLNEAVWLVYTIQAYDFIYDSLSSKEREFIENGILEPVALFLSVESPHVFNRIHNHATWSTAAVGMTGMVINKQDWVEQALKGLDKSGETGFLKQLDVLFSPDGYYTEGPYYQRYALMPFITFARAIENNRPEQKIFEYRQGILLKAIDTLVQSSYNGLFFPINDAIKDKGIDTIELVHGVAAAYALSGNQQLIDIARQQDQILLTGDGLKIARAMDSNQQAAYQYESRKMSDGANGDQGALITLRQTENKNQTIVFKATAQGMGHGHFDKLNWIFYDAGKEIVTDYGAARFLNIEAKAGGRYLPENQSWAKQTIAHNTLVVDESSHFDGHVKKANQFYPTVSLFDINQKYQIASASIDSAYSNVTFTRTMISISLPGIEHPLVVDLLEANSDSKHQYDLPLHYDGQLINTNFDRKNHVAALAPLGVKNGYQHLWIKAAARPAGKVSQITWLNANGRFYTHHMLKSGDQQIFFTELGANDPDDNLRSQRSIIYRVNQASHYRFISLLEPHGEYNPSKEYTLGADAKIKHFSFQQIDKVGVVRIEHESGENFLMALNLEAANDTSNQFNYAGKTYRFIGQSQLFLIGK